MNNEFSIYDITDEDELSSIYKKNLLPFGVEFYITSIGCNTTDKNILKQSGLPDDILDNLNDDDEIFEIPKSYGSKLNFIKFMEKLGFIYDSCNF